MFYKWYGCLDFSLKSRLGWAFYPDPEIHDQEPIITVWVLHIVIGSVLGITQYLSGYLRDPEIPSELVIP